MRACIQGIDVSLASPIPVDDAVRRVIRPTHKTGSDESKARSEKENKMKVQIISAETEALIEKICPHANATASGRKSGLA